jgi:hypothetical protein
MARLLEQAALSVAAGMQDSAAVTAYRPDEAALLVNLRATPDGQAEVRNGSQRTHTTALNSGAQGYGIIQFTTTAGVDQRVVFVGDSAYYSTDDGANWTLIASTLRQDYWSLATMNVGGTHYLYCANGSTTLYSWDGATWATVTGPTTGVTLLAVHNERLWAAKGSTLYASKVQDPTTWAVPDGLSLPVLTHDGDSDVTGLFSLGPWLLVWKRRSMGYVEGYGRRDVIVAAGGRGISREIGCYGARTVVGVGAGVMWLSGRGFCYYAIGGVPQVISGSVEASLLDLNWGQIEAATGTPCAYFYPRKKTYECYAPSNGAQNDMAFVFRLPEGEQPGAASLFDSATDTGQTIGLDADDDLVLGGGSRARVVDLDLTVVSSGTPGQYVELDAGDDISLITNDTLPAAVCLADRGEDTTLPAGIGYDGFCRDLDTGLLDDVFSDDTGGVDINDRYQPRPFTFDDPFRRKRARVVRVRITSDREVNPVVKIYGDGNVGTSHTLTIPAAVNGAAREDKARVSKRGDTLLVEVTGAGAGSKISGVALAAEFLAERP